MRCSPAVFTIDMSFMDMNMKINISVDTDINIDTTDSDIDTDTSWRWTRTQTPPRALSEYWGVENLRNELKRGVKTLLW
jgi:hypothetical protein